MFRQTSCKSQQVCLSQNNSNFRLACEESWRDLSRLCVRPISSVRSHARDARMANLVTRALVVMRNREWLWGRECKENEPRPALCACFKLESTTYFLAGCVQPPFRSCPSLSLSFSDRYEKDCSADDSGADQLIAGRAKAYPPWLIVSVLNTLPRLQYSELLTICSRLAS